MLKLSFFLEFEYANNSIFSSFKCFKVFSRKKPTGCSLKSPETKPILKKYIGNDFRDMKTTNPTKYKKIIREIIKVDLESVVNQADYLIVKWDKAVFKGGGTHGEITMAYWLGKPVYLVNNLPINDVSSWIFSCSEEIFDNFENLKKIRNYLFIG